MRDGWTETMLGLYIHINTGKLDVNGASEFGEYPFFTCSRETYRIDEAAFEGESVIVAGNGDLNVKYYDGKFNAYQRTYVLNSVDKAILDNRFLFLFMQTYIDFLRSETRGTVIQYLKKGQFTDAKIKLPPLPEQKRIVDLISSVDSYIEALRQELASAQSIRSSISESLWGSFSLRSKLSSFGETLTGSTPPTKKLQYWESHDVDFFTPSDLGTSLKLNTASRGVSRQGAAICRPLKGFSVLQVCIGATIGKVGYLSHAAVMNQQINALTNLTKHDAPILAAILSSETFQSIIRNTAGGSTLPIISKSSWGEIQIPHVPKNERIRVSLTILESDSFIEQSRQLLLSAEKMRSSILHNLLTGTHEIPSSYDEVIGAA